MRIFREYWCLGSDEELLKNFETYMQQVLSTIYENNWYINPNRFSNPIELFNYIIHIHNYGFTEDNDESDEENEHSDEESDVYNYGDDEESSDDESNDEETNYESDEELSYASNQLDNFDVFDIENDFQPENIPSNDDFATVVRTLFLENE